MSAELPKAGESIKDRRAPTRGAQRRRAEPGEMGPTGAARSAGASDEIARSIAADLREWEVSRAELTSTPREQTAHTALAATSRATTVEASSEQSDLPYVFAAKRKHSAEYLNAELRKAVLEARMTSADESERKIVAAKLERAKADLKALDAVCREEASLSRASMEQSQIPAGETGPGNENEAAPAAR